jgi:hypothetical protein
MAKFIKMVKDGKTIDVSPLTVESHKKAGWKLVEEMSPQQLEEAKLAASSGRSSEEKKSSTK